MHAVHTAAAREQREGTHTHTHLFMCADNLRKIIINYASRRPFKVHLAKRERIIEMAQQREREEGRLQQTAIETVKHRCSS